MRTDEYNTRAQPSQRGVLTSHKCIWHFTPAHPPLSPACLSPPTPKNHSAPIGAHLSKLSTGRVLAGVTAAAAAAAGSRSVSRGVVACGAPVTAGLLPRLSVRLRLLRVKPGAALLRGGVGVPGDGTPDDGERPAGPPAAAATFSLASLENKWWPTWALFVGVEE